MMADPGLYPEIPTPPQGPIVPQTALAQLGAMLGSLGPSIGQPNLGLQPFEQQRAQENMQFKQKLEAATLQNNVNRLRSENTRLLLSLAKDLPDDPASTKKKMEIYNQSGLVRFSPEEMTGAVGMAQGKQTLQMLPQIIGAIQSKVSDQDLETLFPGVGQRFNLGTLRQLKPDALIELAGPKAKEDYAQAVSAKAKSELDLAKGAREARMTAGTATPIDLMLEGAKTPEDIGSRLATQAATTGVPAPPEYQRFLQAYAREKELKGLSQADLLAYKAAGGDVTATRALQLFKDATKVQKLVGEVKGAYMNKNGDYAPTDIPTKEATLSGYFEVTPKEEMIVHGLPTMLTMVSQLMGMAKGLRDAGVTRTQGGLVGIGQAMNIKTQRFMGEPLGAGGLLKQWDTQKAELIAILRNLGEKGNQAWRGMAPQVEGMTPEAGFPTVIRQLRNLEVQLKADVRQSRIPGYADKIPVSLPSLLEVTDPRYKTLRAHGLMDRDIEQKGDIIVVK